MILAFHDVSCAARSDDEGGLVDATFALAEGALAVVRIDGAHGQAPLCDLAQGLRAPDRGVVTMRGGDWARLSPDRGAALRGQIGRVFRSGGWLSNLDVDENVTLAQRYHATRPEAEILEEARALARRLGLEDLPGGRPHTVGRERLKRSQWVRALLGRPRLLLLEQPGLDAPRGLDLLVDAVAATRGDGAAVLWLTADPREWEHPGLNPTLKFELKDLKMHPVEAHP